MSLLRRGIDAVERGLVPDVLTRWAIRRLCAARLKQLQQQASDPRQASHAELVASLAEGPLAAVPQKANEQHYELPVEFFAAVLGPRRKYSCCYWDAGCSTLTDAEKAALEITCSRAQLADGQRVLDLGCGWGSLSLWVAQRYPNSRILAVSNSSAQRRFIESEASSHGLSNLEVVTADMNDFQPGPGWQGGFDRVVSIEMFEHMRNIERLLSRIATWLQPDGKLFVHVFCHRDSPYLFESDGDANWMGRYFFTGGMMPSADLYRAFDGDLTITDRWTWNGRHYRRTAEAWLANLDAQREAVMQVLARTYGPAEAARWLHRWRIFFLAVAELFGYDQGRQWHVAQYLFAPTRSPAPLPSSYDSAV